MGRIKTIQKRIAAKLDEAAEAKRWTPVRRGPVFCSPGCGSGCTRREYDAAVAGSVDLVERLSASHGEGWTPIVWENMGWFYRVERGTISVRPVGEKGRYGCMLASDPSLVGSGYGPWTESGDFRLPGRAVDEAIEAAQRHVARLRAAISLAL